MFRIAILLLCFSLVERGGCIEKRKEACIYYDSTHSGLDLKPGYPASSKQCRADCWAEPRCAGATHLEGDCCYLHAEIQYGRVNDDTRLGATLVIKDCPIKQRMKPCVYRDSTHSGLDIKILRHRTAEQCRKDCERVPRCQGSTRDTDGSCYLHSYIDRRRIKDGTRPGATLYIQYCHPKQRTKSCVYKDSTHKGLLMDRSFTYIVRPEICKDHCLLLPLCAGSTTDEKGNCYKHYRIEESRIKNGTRPGASLFVRQCDKIQRKDADPYVYSNSTHVGREYSSILTTAESCKQSCDSVETCVGTTYDERGYCYMHYLIEEYRIKKGTKPGATLYVKDRRKILPFGSCVLSHTAYFEHAYLLPTDVENSDDCRLLCMDDPLCYASTYKPTGSCQLHSKTNGKIVPNSMSYNLFMKSC